MEFYYVTAGAEERFTTLDILETYEEAIKVAQEVREQEQWNGWPVPVEYKGRDILILKY